MPGLRQFKHEAEGWLVRQALLKHHGNVTLAAKEVRANRTDFYMAMKRHWINPEDFRGKKRPPVAPVPSTLFRRFLQCNPAATRGLSG